MKSSLLICMLALLAAALVGAGHAQTLPIGLVVPNPVPQDMNCPTDIKMHSFPAGTACYTGTITGCTGLADIAFTFGVLNPTGPAGTIVLFSHGDGTTLDFAPDLLSWYNQKGFQTIEVIWQQASTTNGTLVAWEQSQSVLDDGTTPTSIQQAACRPATLLNYLASPNVYTKGGMCAEGISAGSAAIAYSLTEYGIDLDAVEFHSGPPLADIRAGCADPAASQNVCEGTEKFCQTGTEGGWSDLLQYVMGANADIDRWTNINPNSPSCAAIPNPNPNATAYKDMSVVDGLANSTFDFPSTAVNIWVCAPKGLSNGVCGGSNQNSPPNNTAGEGWFFADQISKFGSARALNLYRVDNCSNSEDVGAGMVPTDLYSLGTCKQGQTVIKNDMAHYCTHPNPHPSSH